MTKGFAVQAILFDSDNTLYDYKGAQSAACEAVIAYAGVGDAANLNSYFLLNPFHSETNRIITYYLNDAGIFNDDTIQSACTVYNRKKLEKTVLFDGVYETVARLREQKIQLGIVTNSRSRDVGVYLEKNGINDFFQCIVSPDEANAKKPALVPFELALSLLAVKSRDSLMVGDNIMNDLVPAKKLGMKTILFDNQGDNTQPVRSECQDIDYCITSFREIHAILGTISP